MKALDKKKRRLKLSMRCRYMLFDPNLRIFASNASLHQEEYRPVYASIEIVECLHALNA